MALAEIPEWKDFSTSYCAFLLLNKAYRTQPKTHYFLKLYTFQMAGEYLFEGSEIH